MNKCNYGIMVKARSKNELRTLDDESFQKKSSVGNFPEKSVAEYQYE